jgi:hypothetical protein
MKYEIGTRFRDKHTKAQYAVGEAVELTEERAAEIRAKLGAGALIEIGEQVTFEAEADDDATSDVSDSDTSGGAEKKAKKKR